VEPELPPPPYTSLITSPVPAEFASAGAATKALRPVAASTMPVAPIRARRDREFLG
jgi:hypothetical protein